MESCGYIYTGDRKSNLQETLEIEVYPCADISDIRPDTPVWRCTMLKSCLRVAESDPSAPPVSYLTLKETGRTAIRFDKELYFPALLSFGLDADGNPLLKFEKNVKEVFPVPDKRAVFGKTKNYINITSAFGEERYLTPLLASVVCDLLNCLAMNSGCIDDRIFYQSCGRVFADADFFMSSLRGRHMLKNDFAVQFATLHRLSRGLEIPLRITPRRYKKFIREPKEVKGDDIWSIRHNAACRLVSETGFFGFASHGSTVRALADAVVLAMGNEVDLLVKNGALSKADNAQYVTADDILAAGFDPQCRENLDGLSQTCRKFFNAAADREIVCIDSGGRIS